MVFDDVKMTLEMINEQKNGGNKAYYNLKRESFSKISPCYLFSNENLREYYPHFKIKDGNVLTVCGSGDQVISSILYDAKNIDVFDSNKLTYYNLMLKIAAIESLSYDQFISFYSINDMNVDRLELYEKISANIYNENIRVFWDKIINDDVFNFFWLFFESNGLNEFVIKRIPYMDNQNFNVLKNKVNGINIIFKNSDIFQLFDEFNKEYNFINLSNIYSYIKDKNKFIELCNKLKKYRLLDDGSILLNYNWSIDVCCCKSNIEVFEMLNAQSILINDIACSRSKSEGCIKVLKKSL